MRFLDALAGQDRIVVVLRFGVLLELAALKSVESLGRIASFQRKLRRGSASGIPVERRELRAFEVARLNLAICQKPDY